MNKTQYKTTLGEVIVYPEPMPELAAFIARVQKAVKDRSTTENDLIALVWGPENPLLDHNVRPGRSVATVATYKNPAFGVLLDLIQAKSIASGKTSVGALEASFDLSVDQAVEAIGGITPDAVRKAIRSGKIAGEKRGRDYFVDSRSVALFKTGRRPRGPTAAAPGPALTVTSGNAPGRSFRVKFASLVALETTKKEGATIRKGEVPSFEQGGICFSEKKASGKTTNRFFVLKPSRTQSRYAQGPFFVEGRFEVVETVNGERESAEAFRAFEPS